MESEMSTAHWGEASESLDVGTELFSAELTSHLIQQGKKVDALRIPQPCKEEEAEYYEVPAECGAADSIVTHTILLLQHAKALQGMIRVGKEQANDVDFDVTKSLPSAPDIPEPPPKAETHELNYPLRYIEKTLSPFAQGEGIAPFKLDAYVAKKILRKSVATLLAHLGYDGASYLVLDTLTDVAEEYIEKFTRLLRVAVDQEALTGSTGFPDVMERAFHEMGIGSMVSLHEFYQCRVLQYHERMLAHCNALQDEYASLALPVLRPVIESEIIRCGPTEVENEDDIPEIHFPALGEGYSADELQPSLEPGFQMLHSLEQEEHEGVFMTRKDDS